MYLEAQMKLRIPLVLIIGLLLCSAKAHSQDKTAATDHKKEIKKRKEAPRDKKLLFIVKNNTKNILYGNKCFQDVQRSMGFEYLVQPKGQARNRNEVSRNLHNFGVKFVLVFRNGPFYGIKLKKKKKECRQLTGDFVG